MTEMPVRLKQLLSGIALLGLTGCVISKPLPALPSVNYAPYPGGEDGPAIPLRLEKRIYTSTDDPEASAFATERDVRAKAAKTCGFDRIIYDQAGPELIFGTGQTADLIHARALLMWCRAYEPKARPGAVLRVSFETTGDLIFSVSSRLETANGKLLTPVTKTPGGYKMITAVYESARDAVAPISDKILSGDDVFNIWCRKAPVTVAQWPSVWLFEVGQDATYKVLGDTSKLYGGLSNSDDCEFDRARCEIRFTKSFDISSLPTLWVGSAYARNDYPRPGIEKGSSLLINSYARWINEGGLPRLRHFTEYDTRTWRKPCSTRPVPQVNGLSGTELDFFLNGRTGSPIDEGWSEPDADCRASRFEMGDSGLDGEGTDLIRLMASKYGSLRMRSSYIFLMDGRTYMKASFSLDNDRPTYAGPDGCETTILN